MGKAKSGSNKPAAKKEVPEFIKHVVTQEDLDNNEELAASGVQVGDEIEVPNPEYVAPEKGGKFSEDLKGTLEKHPHINCVWINEAGDTWHYNARPGFTAYSREEILKG